MNTELLDDIMNYLGEHTDLGYAKKMPLNKFIHVQNIIMPIGLPSYISEKYELIVSDFEMHSVPKQDCLIHCLLYLILDSYLEGTYETRCKMVENVVEFIKVNIDTFFNTSGYLKQLNRANINRGITGQKDTFEYRYLLSHLFKVNFMIFDSNGPSLICRDVRLDTSRPLILLYRTEDSYYLPLKYRKMSLLQEGEQTKSLYQMISSLDQVNHFLVERIIRNNKDVALISKVTGMNESEIRSIKYRRELMSLSMDDLVSICHKNLIATVTCVNNEKLRKKNKEQLVDDILASVMIENL